MLRVFLLLTLFVFARAGALGAEDIPATGDFTTWGAPGSHGIMAAVQGKGYSTISGEKIYFLAFKNTSRVDAKICGSPQVDHLQIYDTEDNSIPGTGSYPFGVFSPETGLFFSLAPGTVYVSPIYIFISGSYYKPPPPGQYSLKAVVRVRLSVASGPCVQEYLETAKLPINL